MFLSARRHPTNRGSTNAAAWNGRLAMNRLLHIGITVRLLLLVLIAVLPALAIQSYNEFDLRRSREADTRERVIQITKQFGEEMGELREGARQLLVALTQLPSIRAADGAQCTPYLKTLKATYPNYLVLAAVDLSGKTICSSSSIPQQITELPFFRMALAHDGIVVGNYWKDPVNDAQALHLAMRFKGPDGQVAGVVYAALDLAWLSDLLKDRGLPTGGSILIADRMGNIIARLPHPEQLVGKNMRKSHEAIMDGDKAGWEEAGGVDGITRIFGYVPPALPPYDLFLSAGLSKVDALADIVHATHRGVALIVAGLLVAMFAAWFLGRYFIQRPIIDLLRVTSDWRIGNYEARARTFDSNSELGCLSIAFNEMADAVATRQAAQKQAEQELLALASTLEERVEQRTEELAHANRIKSQFLANMSHEIRTPMNGVLGILELLLETDLSPKQRRYAQTALRSGESLLGIVNGVLDLSKIESGKLQLIEEAFDLHNSVEDTIELLASAARAKNLNLAYLISETVPQHVIGDAGRLRQILTNLVGNAIKFTETGEVIVYVSNAGATRDDVEVEFKVRDTGIGIPVEKLREVFDPFSQVDGSSSRRYGGTGLGLNIARQLCELMGGTISVESTPGAGSVFRFSVRLKVASIGREATAAPPSVLGGMSALVVDDNETNLEILCSQLARMGMQGSAANTAEAALTALRERELRGQHFDFILIDKMLQGADGSVLARELRARHPLSQTYLVLLSSYEDIDDGETSAFDNWLTKPVRQSELQQCLVALRNRTTMEATPAKSATVEATPGFSGTTVLLVEDNEINMEVARSTLAREGCIVTTAMNGKQALAALKNRGFDIIFMDCQMPEMDGFEATSAIRALPAEQGRRTPIVALTANAVEGDREICLRAGMDDYLAKPFTRASVRAALTRWCGQPLNSRFAQIATNAGASMEPEDELSEEALAMLRDLEDPEQPNFMHTVLSRFLRESDELANRLVRAAKERNAAGLCQTSHTLKSTGGIVGARMLAACCAKLELAAREGRVDEAVLLVETALVRLERVKPAIRRQVEAGPQSKEMAEVTV